EYERSPSAIEHLAFGLAEMANATQHLSIDSSASGSPTLSSDLKGDDLYDAAKASFDRGNYKAAIELFKRVVDADPKHKTAWMDLGRACMMTRQTKDSIAAIEKKAELERDDTYAYAARSRAYATPTKKHERYRASNT